MTKAQMLRRLQLAVDHIDRVIQECEGGDELPELTEALDHIHLAESAIEQGGA